MPTQPLLYFVDLAGARRRVEAIAGREALSETWRFDVELVLAPDDPLDPDEVVGAQAVLALSRAEDLRRVEGVVTSVSREATRTGDAGGGRVKLTLEPRMALARWRVDIRVFRDKTAPEIVAEVLAFHGVAVTPKLGGSYPRRPYCVQMRESDLAFCARLLEDEGIYFVVEDAGAATLGDDPSGYGADIGVLPFHHDSQLEGQRDAVFAIGWVGRATAGTVTLRDFNPDKPSLDMDVSAAGPTPWGPEWYDYPGEYALPAEGAAKAQRRAEALACQKHRLAGRSSCAALRPGARCELDGAPPGIAGGEQVVVSVTHEWRRAEAGFSIGFEALAGKTGYRPPLVTRVPTLTNPLTGFVTGPADADIHTDEWGRVKVHFPWDRVQPKDDRCSHWIPVLQDNTGRSSAMPRTGWEVLCDFLEGDPDRPVVLGRVFNAADPFLEDLPLRKTRTALMSLTSPRAADGPSGFNMIRFDDLAQAECIDLHAERDQVITVAHDQKEDVDSVELRVVKGHETVKVGADQHVHTARDYAPNVDGNQQVTVGAARTVTAKESHSDVVGKNHALTIGGGHTRTFGCDDGVNVGRSLREQIGGVVIEGSVKANTVAAGKRSLLAVGAAIVEIARKGKSEMANQARGETVGTIAFTKAREIATRAAKSRTTVVGGAYLVSALKEILLAGLTKLSTQSLTVVAKSPSITLKVGQTSVVMKDGRIVMTAAKRITLATDEENKQHTSTADQI